MNPSWIHLGGLFSTRLYHPALAGTPPEEGNWNHLGGLFPMPLYLHPCRRTSMQAYILVGESAQGGKCDFHGSVFGELSRTAELTERLASKSMTYVIARLLFWGGTSLCRAETLIQSEFPKITCRNPSAAGLRLGDRDAPRHDLSVLPRQQQPLVGRGITRGATWRAAY